MAWTVAEAQARAGESYLDDEDIDDADAIRWANDFMREKVDSRYYPRTDWEVTVAEKTWTDLPADFVTVVEMKDSSDQDYRNYLIDDNQIRFGTADTYTVAYRAEPATLALASEVALPVLWLSAMGYFMASRFRSKDDSEDPDAAVKMTECDKIIQRAMGQRRATNNPMRVRMRW